MRLTKKLIKIVENYEAFLVKEWLIKLIDYADIDDIINWKDNLFKNIEKMNFKHFTTSFNFLHDYKISNFKEAYENGLCKNIFDLANYYLHDYLKRDVRELILLINELEKGEN